MVRQHHRLISFGGRLTDFPQLRKDHPSQVKTDFAARRDGFRHARSLGGGRQGKTSPPITPGTKKVEFRQNAHTAGEAARGPRSA